MTWDLIAGLIIQYGLPFVEKMISLWQNKSPVTQAEWDALKALAQNTALSQMKAALARAGIAEDSPEGQAILAKVPV